MKNPVFTGAGVAIITPMYEDGSINFDELGRIVEDQIARGTDAIVICGTTGECSTMTDEEQLAAIKYTVDLVNHRVPVIAGAGSNDTAHTVRMVEQTQEAGCDAVLVVAPYYSRPSQEGIFRHYQAVNESADKPIIIYDVPGRTGVHIQLETYRRMAELDHVKAVKDATGDIAGAVRKRLETGLTWYSGDDGLFLPFLSVGAVGIISVIAHAAAGPMRDSANAFDQGDIHTAQKIAVQLSPLVESLNGTGFQAVMAKAALKVRGVLDCTTMRLPNVGPGEPELERAREGMRAAGLL